MTRSGVQAKVVMTNLVKRLREQADTWDVDVDRLEAADEIERLQNLLVEAKTERDIWRERALSK